MKIYVSKQIIRTFGGDEVKKMIAMDPRKAAKKYDVIVDLQEDEIKYSMDDDPACLFEIDFNYYVEIKN